MNIGTTRTGKLPPARGDVEVWSKEVAFIYDDMVVPNHVKLLHEYKSRRGFSKGTVLCGEY